VNASTNGTTTTDWDHFRAAAADALAATLDEPVAPLLPEHHLIDDLGLDSFGVLTFMSELEARLGATVPPSYDEPTLANLHRLVTDARRNA
jgi:acyl carrier protein